MPILWFVVWIATWQALMLTAAGTHGDYTNWASQKTDNCCNEQDCHELVDDEWREGPEGPEVYLRGEYCRIKAEHFIVTGKSPNAEHAHVCVRPNEDGMSGAVNGESANCRRVICFVGPFKS